MGMSSDEFWHGELKLVKSYREAYRIKQEIKDYELWKQGMYVYEAILNASPILHAFAKKGTKPRPYPEKPYGLEKQESKKQKAKRVENERLKAQVHFMNWAKAVKKRIGEKKNGS